LEEALIEHKEKIGWQIEQQQKQFRANTDNKEENKTNIK